tara:strand:+ start:640 stop:1464 length:825 start_codon:yes stop_codon:yes gene_type:complete
VAEIAEDKIIKVAVSGASGRMGKAIISQIISNPYFRLVAAFDRSNSSLVGSDATAFIGKTSGIMIASEFSKPLTSTPDVLIDFTLPVSTINLLEFCEKYKIPAVIGTTGFSSEEKRKIANFAEKYGAVFSPNMSPGVNITFKLLENAASFFTDEYDVEIIESHHRNKVDAPSGTALAMAKILSSVKKNLIESEYCFGRKGVTGTRKKNEIGFSVVRGGDIVGEHSVIFAGIGETIELTHKSSSRDSYSKGALLAAKFLCENTPGLYSMNDVLSL